MIAVRIQSSDSTTFRGFAIQARQSTEAFSNDASFLGQFDSNSAVAASDWKIWECATVRYCVCVRERERERERDTERERCTFNFRVADNLISTQPSV